MAHPLPTPTVPSDYYGGYLIPTTQSPGMRDFLKPADVGFSHGRAWYSRIIRWATRHRTEPPTYTNHTFGLGRDLAVVEALSAVTATSLDLWQPSQEFEVFRHLTLPYKTRTQVARRAESYIGNVYGGLKIVPHLLDGLLGKVAATDVYAFRRLCFLPRYPICSWLWGWAYTHFQIPLSACDVRYASPDDQHDYLTGAGSSVWALVMKRFPDGQIVAWNDVTGYPVREGGTPA
jgi:hypothetical protein